MRMAISYPLVIVMDPSNTSIRSALIHGFPKLKTGRFKDTDEGNSKYSVKCELCQGKIIFKKKKHKECLKNVEVKEKIREECGKFIWLLFSVITLTVLIFGVVGLIIRSASDKAFNWT